MEKSLNNGKLYAEILSSTVLKLESVYGFGGPPINLGIPWEPPFNWIPPVSIKSKI